MVLFLGLIIVVQGQPNFELAGFATENGGTTGGAAGQMVTATSYSQLKSYAESATPYTIMVQGTISNGSDGGRIRVASNKSIIGEGSTTLLSGVGIEISNENNIIIRNIKITLVGTTNPGSVNGGDCMSIRGSSRNIWIDHCEVYSEDPDIQTDIDKYDGLIDIRDQTGFITLSWNYFHDHHKGFLVGASDDDIYEDRKVTYHHNYFNKVRKRVPMYRGSYGHFFNNYILGAIDATEIRAGTCVRVEKNYYEQLHYSIYTPSDFPGSTERIDNIEVDKATRPYPADCVADIPYAYSSVLTNNTEDVKTMVPQYAGVGVLIEDCNGDLGGTAFEDECSVCVGGSTGKVACEQDCNGDWGGSAEINECSECVGGNTGVDPEKECVVNSLEGGLLMVHPNPTSGWLHLPKPAPWQVFSLLGKELLSGVGSEVNVSLLETGCYLLKTENHIQRILKQ